MTPEQEQKVLSSLYDRLHDAVTYSPDGKSAAFPKNVYFQMTKNTVLSPGDFADMVSPENPSGDQRTAEAFSAMVDALPKPGALWSDSGKKLSDVLSGILAQANTDSKPSESQVKDYTDAYNFLNTTTTTKDYKGNEKSKVEPSAIAIEYDNAQSAYIAAVSGFRTAYNGYDLTKKEDQRAWNAAAPALQNLLNQTWNAWVRAGKDEVEGARAAMASTINDAVRSAIEQARRVCGDEYRLPSAAPAGRPWFPSYALPTNWAAPDTKGCKLQFSSAYLNKTESETAHGYGLEASGSYGLFHASGGVEGNYKTSNHHMDAQNLTLEAELIAVTIMRPWFNPLLFGMNSWWVTGYDAKGLSNGDAKNPQGEVPLIPVGFVVARNVKVTADFSEEDKKFVSNSISTKASGGWGPFSVSGKYSYSNSSSEFQSKFDGGSLVFPGLQLIAWIATVTPASPPLAVPKRAAGR
jgi:hypothetical protein